MNPLSVFVVVASRIRVGLLNVACFLGLLSMPSCAWAAGFGAPPAVSTPPADGLIASAPVPTAPITRPRLRSTDLGLVINTDDPYSVAIGTYYARQRGIPPERVLRLSLPVRGTLTELEFSAFKGKVNEFFGKRTQALALAWVQPWAVQCQSITGALALGFDAGLCRQTCDASRASPYFASTSTKPMRDRGLRLSMLLAAPDEASGRALIDRGVQADGSQMQPGAPGATAWFVSTSDAARNVRAVAFPPSRSLWSPPLDVRLAVTDTLRDVDRVMLYLTGLAQVDGLETVHFAPGALADHLTSVGGVLLGSAQMSALRWIEAGATASYGTVSEPCNHRQKFPHPQVLLQSYLSGSTAIEAYWRSVAWPAQGVFVGEPLAAPYAKD